MAAPIQALNSIKKVARGEQAEADEQRRNETQSLFRIQEKRPGSAGEKGWAAKDAVGGFNVPLSALQAVMPGSVGARS